MAENIDAVKAPALWKLALEARAPWEYAAMLAATPVLRRLPMGDGHPVIVFPGLGAGDLSTRPLRHFLHGRSYDAHPWRQGFNLGPRAGVLEACLAQLKALHYQHQQKVSLIGWSLGGIYARELAKELPELVRCVITLGSPFSGPPRATNAWRFFELVSGQSAQQHELVEQIKVAPRVPTTSIFSRTDGVVAWQCSINPDMPHCENIEVMASHIGMGMNPLALAVIADRLAQPESGWQRFDAQGAARWFAKTVPGPQPAASALAA